MLACTLAHLLRRDADMQVDVSLTIMLQNPLVNPENDRNENDYHRSTRITDSHSRTGEYLRHGQHQHHSLALNGQARFVTKEGRLDHGAHCHSPDHRQAVERYP